MRPRDIARLRLETQRVAATEFDHPAEVVRWLGAVQAQDYLGALWGIGLRLRGAHEADVERSLSDGSIVRTWPMRGTLHFVAAADARWILELLGPRIVAGAASRMRSFGVDQPTLRRARRIVVGALEGRRNVARPALYRALEAGKIRTDNQRGLHILWRLAHECLVCFGPREGKQQSFALFDEWLPAAKSLPREESLAELARRYFTGHGPATVRDFAWWSGLALSDARFALDLVKGDFVHETVEGRPHWFAPTAALRGRARGKAYLLPAFDEFLVGYADRSAAAERGRSLRASVSGSILDPSIVIDGRVVGTWKRRLARGKVDFLPAPFAPLGPQQARAVSRAFRRYNDFLR